MTENEIKAIITFVKRRERHENPFGRFIDRIWYPSLSEKKECCNNICRPSKIYPYGYMIHCRSAKHISMLYEIDVRTITYGSKIENLTELYGIDKYIDAYIDRRLGKTNK